MPIGCARAVAYRRSEFVRAAVFAAALLSLAASPAAAQFAEVLHSFSGSAMDGSAGSVMQAADGSFYGLSSEPSPHGSIYRVTPGGTPTVLHTFAGGAGGSAPTGRLLQGTDGMFYGTTVLGGAAAGCPYVQGCGTVFRMTPDGAVTVLHAFTLPEGTGPASLIQGADGDFYGVASSGGSQSCGATSGCGTIFRMTAAGTMTLLHAFEGSEGGAPHTLIQASDGTFYGTTRGVLVATEIFFPPTIISGGTVFRLTPDGAFTTLHAFTGGTDGMGPTTVIQARDGALYGLTANYHGARMPNGPGTIFRIDGDGLLTTLHTFGVWPEGWAPQGLLQASDGNLYGTTMQGGLGGGIIYRMTLAGGMTTLHEFAGTPDGAGPAGGLIQGMDGRLFGTTSAGGAVNRGTWFRSTAAIPESQPCAWFLSPKTWRFGPAGGTINVSIASGSTCPWSTTSSSQWIGSSAGTGLRMGPGTVSVTASGNPSRLPRVGHVTIGNQTLTITQAGRAAVASDFNGDGRSDPTVFRPSEEGGTRRLATAPARQRGGLLLMFRSLETMTATALVTSPSFAPPLGSGSRCNRAPPIERGSRNSGAWPVTGPWRLITTAMAGTTLRYTASRRASGICASPRTAPPLPSSGASAPMFRCQQTTTGTGATTSRYTDLPPECGTCASHPMGLPARSSGVFPATSRHQATMTAMESSTLPFIDRLRESGTSGSHRPEPWARLPGAAGAMFRYPVISMGMAGRIWPFIGPRRAGGTCGSPAPGRRGACCGGMRATSRLRDGDEADAMVWLRRSIR